jgi:hypothetical protein
VLAINCNRPKSRNFNSRFYPLTGGRSAGPMVNLRQGGVTRIWIQVTPPCRKFTEVAPAHPKDTAASRRFGLC